MGAFLCWLGVRLLEMHRILANDGSLYLHIDHTAHAWVKCLLDAIFGRRNFRNEIVWAYPASPSTTTRDYPRKHDTLLRYTKTNRWVFNADDIRVPYSESSNVRARYAANASTVLEGTTIKLNEGGKIPPTVWDDVQQVYCYRSERTGFPTQKPLALYERIIKASSNEGDVVLDPFCGCATTPIAAERLGRQWVGMDIWDGAHQMVLDRLESEGLAVPNRRGRRGQGALITFGDIHYETKPPTRTDGGEPATLTLRTPTGSRALQYPAPRSQHGKLLTDIGPFCQGCGADYTFDARVLEVDHINPRSQGGTDAYDNLTLLCPPCNKEKRDRYTLIGLQQVNRAAGWMKNEGNLRMGRAAGRTGGRRR